jgi:hypothetical protein
MLGMAKEDIGIVGKLRGKVFLVKYSTSLSQLLMFLLVLKKSPSVGAAWAIKPVVGTTGKGGYNQWQKSEKSGTILIALNLLVASPNIWDGISGFYEAAPNDKIFFRVIRQLLIQMWWI